MTGQTVYLVFNKARGTLVSAFSTEDKAKRYIDAVLLPAVKVLSQSDTFVVITRVVDEYRSWDEARS